MRRRSPAGCFEPLLAIHRGGTAGTGRGDRLAVVGIDDVAAGEDAFDVGRGAVIGQAIEQPVGGLDAFPGQGGPGEEIAVWRGGELALKIAVFGTWPIARKRPSIFRSRTELSLVDRSLTPVST